jgi:serine/threonine protein kinase
VIFTDPGTSILLDPTDFGSSYPWTSSVRRTDRHQIVNLNHFRLLRVVGKGAFGKVRIVERKDSGLTFALKYIRKEEGKHRI